MHVAFMWRLRVWLVAVLLAGVWLARGNVAFAEQAPVRVPGTQVSLVAPEGFKPAELFSGFQRDDMGSSIMIMEMPTSAGNLRPSLTKDNLATQGMALLSLESVRIDNQDGLLAAVTQTVNDVPFRKWLGLFGTSQTAVMLVATYPDVFAAEMAEPLKRAVLSARLTPTATTDVFEGLTFRITETATLKVASRISNMLVLTRNGQGPPVPPSEPLLAIGSSSERVQVADIEALARTSLLQTTRVKAIRNLQGAPISIAGLPGYELTAAAQDSESGTELTLYQALVVSENVYYLMRGMVGASASKPYLDEFRAVVASLTLVR